MNEVSGRLAHLAASAPRQQPIGDDRITVTIPEGTRITGLSRSTLLRHAAAGRLETRKVFGRRLIVFASLRELVSDNH
jgi:hypothetical protein